MHNAPNVMFERTSDYPFRHIQESKCLEICENINQAWSLKSWDYFLILTNKKECSWFEWNRLSAVIVLKMSKVKVKSHHFDTSKLGEVVEKPRRNTTNTQHKRNFEIKL